MRLTGLTGTVYALGVRLTASGGPVRWRLGGLAVRDAVVTPGAPTDLRITGADGGNLRFAWQGASGDVRHYELYRTLPDGTRRFLGGTCQSAFYVGGLTPSRGRRPGGSKCARWGNCSPSRPQP